MSIISISKRGSLTLPKPIRKKLGIEFMKDPLIEIKETEKGILLRPIVTTPIRSFKSSKVQEWIDEDQKIAKELKLWSL